MKPVITYLLEGVAIAFVSKYLLGGGTTIKELFLISVTVTAALYVLDQFSPEVSRGTRQGAGFGIGANLVGGGDSLLESMDDPVAVNYYKNDRHFNTLATLENNCDAKEETVSGIEEENALTGSVQALPPQVNTLERFMDDKMAINYYANDRTPQPKSDGLLERFAQTGGADSIEPFNKSDSGLNGVSITEPFETGITAGERGLVYGTLKVEPQQEHLSRLQTTVYSGDLVNITDKVDNELILLDNSQFVRPVSMSKKTGLDNKLFKLRLQLVNGHSSLKMAPVRFGDPVYIVYNNDDAETVYLSHNGDLSNMKSNKDNVFELVDSAKPTSRDPVTFESDVLIRRAVEGEELRYLQNDLDNKKVKTTIDLLNATKYKLVPVKGCGPLWRFDSDTRTSNVYNPSQVRDMIDNKTQILRKDNIALKTELESVKLKLKKSGTLLQEYGLTGEENV
jgi:hypothetical protein